MVITGEGGGKGGRGDELKEEMLRPKNRTVRIPTDVVSRGCSLLVVSPLLRPMQSYFESHFTVPLLLLLPLTTFLDQPNNV